MKQAQVTGMRVKGEARPGHFVTYWDAANQGGEVFAVTAQTADIDSTMYSLRSTETGLTQVSDLRQHGWTFV